MKILVIFTGGTIGSSVQGDYINIDDSEKYKIINSYDNKRKDLHFDTLEPYTILSENLRGENINSLANCVKDNQDDYEGIIITHGTDTLQYTAAGLSILLQGLKVPVVMVSSNYVLEDVRANGLNNFSGAVEYISWVFEQRKEMHENSLFGAGVYVAYDNGDGRTNIYSGISLYQHNAYEDRLNSLKGCVLGTIADGSYVSDNSPIPLSVARSFEIAKEIICDSINTKRDKLSVFSEYSDVLWYKEHPGFSYVMPDENTKCVLLESYHSGTLNSNNKSLTAFIRNCNERKIPVFIVGVEDRIQYESTEFLRDFSITILPEITPIVAYMLLWSV